MKGAITMLPEERARIKIDNQLVNAGWDVVSRHEYIPNSASAVKEALMQGNTESDYLLFVEDKAIAVVEAKKESDPLGKEVEKQAERYAVHPQSWYGLWFEGLIPLVYMANGNKICYKNMLISDSEYEELTEMHSPKKMLQIINKVSEYGALPRLEKRGLRDCQYDAEIEFEKSIKAGNKKNLAVLATGAGKTYLACLASYRLLNYTSVKRILFLVDRNNLARQTESEFSLFDKTENRQTMSSLYQIRRLKKEKDIKGDIIISTIQKLFSVLTGQALEESNEDVEDGYQHIFTPTRAKAIFIPYSIPLNLVEFLVDYIDLSTNPDDVINILDAQFSKISKVSQLVHKLMSIEYDEDNASTKLAKFIDNCEVGVIIKIISDEWGKDDIHKEKLARVLSKSERYSVQVLLHRINENKESISKNDLISLLEFCESDVTENNIESLVNIMRYLLENYFEKDICTQILGQISNLTQTVIAKQRENICMILIEIFQKSSSEENKRKCAVIIKDKRFGRKMKGKLDESELKEYRSYLS